jgi:hypothetical protein
MKQNETQKASRRKFLSLGFLSGAALLTQKASAMTSLAEEDEKVPMLTADGKLVEVSKKTLEQLQSREKTNNEGILKWTDTQYKPKP